MESKMEVEEVSTSPDIPEPPYLKAIQCLNGQKPGEKYRHFNAFIQSIIKICRETGASSVDVIRAREAEIPAALLPLVHILVGIELESKEAVVEALRSSDIVVVNKALRAKWFFDGSNSHVDVPYFMENIFPFVSVRTRMDIVKALTRGLYDAKAKAENFFNLFYDMFGLEQAMPFLPYCSENFLFDTILKFKIVLTIKMLDTIYQRYPNTAIRYLYLGYNKSSDNEADRKVHAIYLSNYVHFFPKLIKKHVDVYMKFLSYLSCSRGKIGSTRRRALIKNAQDFVINETKRDSSQWPLKYIYFRLSKTQFEEYYVSLHPSNYVHYNVMKMFNCLKYYPKYERVDFMKNQFEKFYRIEFFNNLLNGIDRCQLADLFNNDQITEEQFEAFYASIFPKYHNQFNMDNLILNLKNYSDEKMLNLLHTNLKKKRFGSLLEADDEDFEHYESEKYLLLLPVEEKSVNAQHLISFCKRGSDKYYKWSCFLPVEQSFNILKFGAESSNVLKRIDFLKKMIYTCKIYNDQAHLTKVLEYFIQCHKNERSSVLHSLLDHLLDHFNILALHDANWHLFCEMVETAYVKNELFNAPVGLLDKIFEGSLHRLLSEQPMEEAESSSLVAMIHKYLEYKIIYRDGIDWTIFATIPDLENKFIKLFMFHIPIKYPENHEIWREDYKVETVGSKIISKLHKRNQKIINALKPYERNESNLSTLITRVTNYTWLREITERLLRKPNSENSGYLESFKTLVKEFDEEFYLSVIPKIVRDDPRKNILSGKAIWYLRNDCTPILNCWEEYFNTARKMMQSSKQSGAQAAKNFIIASKWQQELPLRFVKSCIAQINKPGSLTILALLVDGVTLSNYLSHYIPSGPTVDIHKVNAIEEYRIISFMPAAINLSVPFVSTEILISMFQHEYTKLGQRSVRNFGQRVDKPSVINFANQLLNRPVSVKKHGIRLMHSILSIGEAIEFLTEISNHKQHPTINVITAHYISYLFITHPSDKTWNLISNFIDKLSCNDSLALKVVINTKKVCNPYASLYLKKLLSKINDLGEQVKRMETEQKTKENGNKKLRLKCKDTSFKENLLKNVFDNVSEESVMFLTKDTILDILQTYYFKSETRIISESLIPFANKIFSRPFIGRK